MHNSTVRYMAERLRARADLSRQAAANLKDDTYYDGRADGFSEAADYLIQVLTDIEAREAVERDVATMRDAGLALSPTDTWHEHQGKDYEK